MQPLVSVVVPIYNIDRYVGTCIESLIKQTYTNLEIILVDDGSTDRSPEICDLYAQKDKRIKVIHKQNGGLVSARKAGICAATGEYVGYVDGDDWVGQGFYADLCDMMCKAQADLVVSGQSRDIFNTSSHILSNIPAGRYEGERLRELQRNMLSYGEFFKLGITTYVWNKLFKRELILKYQNAVDNGITIGEDAAVVYPYIMACKKVCVIDNCEYHYRQREDSMLKKSASYKKEAVGLKLLYAHLCSFAAEHKAEYRLKEQIDDFVLGICIMRSGGILKELQEEYSPYNKEFYGKDIVVWSAGTFGQQLINRITENDYCKVIGWIDEDFWDYRRCCLNVDDIDEIDNMCFDYVLIATVNNELAQSVKSRFMWRGIDQDKILTVNCPKEKRAYLLERYLNV